MRTLFGNESVVGIFVCSLFLLVYSLFSIRGSKVVVSLVCLLYLAITLLVFQSRSALLGFLLGLSLLHKSFFVILWKNETKRLTFFCLIIALFTLLLFAKKDSSSGRIFIYKVSAKIFSNHFQWGIGWGRYKAEHNLNQSSYFATSDINSKEAVLADNTFYAFNDLWQLLLEIGVIRFAALLIVAALLFQLLRQKFIIQSNRKRPFKSAMAALISIATASLFSYPFQIFAIKALAVFCVVCILFSVQPKSVKQSFSFALLRVVQVASVLIFAFVCFQGGMQYHIYQRSKEAFDLAQAGFKKEAATIYSQMAKDYPKEFKFLYPYAQLLYYQNRLHEAKTVVAKAKNLYTDNELYKLSGAIEYELGDYKQAEKDYKTALYMVPNRMRSRLELFNFYLNTKDTIQAKQWGKSILTMPVKIPSEATRNIQRQVAITMERF